MAYLLDTINTHLDVAVQQNTKTTCTFSHAGIVHEMEVEPSGFSPHCSRGMSFFVTVDHVDCGLVWSVTTSGFNNGKRVAHLMGNYGLLDCRAE